MKNLLSEGREIEALHLLFTILIFRFSMIFNRFSLFCSIFLGPISQVLHRLHWHIYVNILLLLLLTQKHVDQSTYQFVFFMVGTLAEVQQPEESLRGDKNSSLPGSAIALLFKPIMMIYWLH